jgi:hypothetical protein
MAAAISGVNIRIGPSLNARVIGTLSAGRPVAVAECTGGWCRLAEPVGWVSQQFLRFSAQPPGGPIGGARERGGNAATPLPGGPITAAPDGGAIAPAPERSISPAAPPVALAVPSFAGTWSTITDKGFTYTMQFSQAGPVVTGQYVVDANGQRGRLNGVLVNNVLSFTWNQDGGFAGSGQFTLAPDGRSFSGSYRANPNPALTANLLTGTWRGQKR